MALGSIRRKNKKAHEEQIEKYGEIMEVYPHGRPVTLNNISEEVTKFIDEKASPAIRRWTSDRKEDIDHIIEPLFQETSDVNTSTIEKDSSGNFIAVDSDDDYNERFLGARPGLDIADPLDVAYRGASVGLRALQKIGRPILEKTTTLGLNFASNFGDPISNQEEAELFLEEYDSGDLINKEGRDITYHTNFEGQEDVPAWFGDTNNIDEHGGRKGSYYWDSGGNEENLPEGGYYAGVNIQPRTAGDEGVEPIVAAEEIMHGKRIEEGVNITPGYHGDFPDYAATLVEESLTKISANAEVFKNEGAIEGLASIPATVSTIAHYALGYDENIGSPVSPIDVGSKRNYKGGEEFYNVITEKYGSLEKFEEAFYASDSENLQSFIRDEYGVKSIAEVLPQIGVYEKGYYKDGDEFSMQIKGGPKDAMSRTLEGYNEFILDGYSLSEMWEDAEYFQERESSRGNPLATIRDWSQRYDLLGQKSDTYSRREKDFTRKVARSNKISYDEAWEEYTIDEFPAYDTQNKPTNLNSPGKPTYEPGATWERNI
tara:strand:- start:16139 stop:17767 length:1629 start_codon:yes stop_codon:yes gene_type:complete